MGQAVTAKEIGTIEIAVVEGMTSKYNYVMGVK